MNITRRGLILTAAAVPLAGCVTGATLAPRGAFSAGSIALNLPRDWSDISYALGQQHPAGMRMLTVNGALLDQFYVVTLAPGEALFPPQDKDTPRATFRADMTDTEIVEFTIDSLSQRFQSPESQALRPQNFGTTPGVRFDIAARTTDGLNYSGTALVARANGKYNGLIFLAPSEHYYAMMLPDVEAALTSAQLT